MLDRAFAERLFAADWYVSIHPEAAAEPFRHFLDTGLAAGFDPNPLFDGIWYARRYGEQIRSGENPFENYVREGAGLGRDPGPLFDTEWYLAKNPDVAAAGANPFEHYLIYGSHEKRDPSPLFDSGWYFAAYPSAVRSPGVDARTHYMAQGHMLGYSPHPLFDTQWYRAAYPEVAEAGENPLLHYVTQGADQGFDPGPNFNTLVYLEHHPGCLEARKNPLAHFLLAEEMRRRAATRSDGDDFPQPSSDAVEEIAALVYMLGGIDSELEKIDGRAASLPVQKSDMEDIEHIWRGLYLSLYTLPRRIVLVGSIDDTPELAPLVAGVPDLLIVETDMARPSLAESLSREAQWRSLPEFGYLPNLARRLTVMTALVNNLRPDAVLVWGSQVGWEMLAAHGRVLQMSTRLFAVAAPFAQNRTLDPVKLHFSSCIPFLSALYGSVAHPVEPLGPLFGLPPSERWKLQHLSDWSQPGGFLEPESR